MPLLDVLVIVASENVENVDESGESVDPRPWEVAKRVEVEAIK